MKLIIVFAVLILSQLAVANDIAKYQIEKGKLHTGGVAQVEIIENNEEKFVARLAYHIYKKILAPIPNDKLKGETTYELPPEFRDERGYLELATKGTIELEKAHLKFIRRLKWRELNDAYQFQILPKNGRSKIDAIYHPSLPAAGWGRILVTFMSNVPILNGYQIALELDH